MALKRSPGNGRNGGRGMILVDAGKINQFIQRRLWTREQAAEAFNISLRTLSRMLNGAGVRPGSVHPIADKMGIPPSELLANGQLGSDLYTNRDSHSANHLEWEIATSLFDWMTLKSGLEFRTYRLKHRFLPDCFARGKCYRLGELPTAQGDSFREYFLRHPKIVRGLRTNPLFPANHAVYAENGNNTWWIIDEWIAGHTLQEAIKIGPLAAGDVNAIMLQIAEGLQTLHRALIIRRSLSPENIVIRKEDGSVLLTDLELSKLHDGSPTVRDQVRDDPYQAPEVSVGGDLDLTVDLYSWGRIFVHAASGQLPDPGKEQPVIDRFPCSDDVKRIVSDCVSLLHRSRPKNVDTVLACFQKARNISEKQR